MTHIKGVLPSGEFHATVRAIQDNDIVWTIDQDGDYAWRNLIETYDDSEYGQARLERTCKNLNRTFTTREDLIGLRARLKVDVQLKGNLRKNVIVEHLLPTQPAQFEVTRERDDSHYFERENKPSLPL